jgi:prepilin-type N-terminal cleavage/methylation domain-containing protein
MRKTGSKAGMTLVEVLIAVVLVSVAASLIYNGGFYSYKILMRSRMRLEAQGIAFDKLWELFNTPKYNDLIKLAGKVVYEPTPTEGAFPVGGTVKSLVVTPPSTNYCEIIVNVYAPSNNGLFSVMNDDGTVRAAYTNSLAEYRILRYVGDR